MLQNIEKRKLILFLTQKYIIKDLQVNSNDFQCQWILLSCAWRLTTFWLKKRGSRIPKIFRNPQKIWQMEFRMTNTSFSPLSVSFSQWLCLSLCLSVCLSLSFERSFIANCRIIHAFSVEPKFLCCLDWRRALIFRNSSGKKLSSIFALRLRKIKTNIWKKKKKKTHTFVKHALIANYASK